MNKLLSTSALAALLTAGSAFSGTLTIPMEFEYLALDGKPIETNLFSHKSELNLTQGNHKIAIRYHDMVDDPFSDSQSFIKSAPFIISLDATKSGEYKLEPKSGSIIKKPNNFAQNPEVVITSLNNVPVNFQIEHTEIEESGFISKLFNKSESSTNPKQVATEYTSLAKSPDNTNTNHHINHKQNTKNENMTSQMLHHWWQQADEQTRKEFMRWAITQL